VEGPVSNNNKKEFRILPENNTGVTKIANVNIHVHMQRGRDFDTAKSNQRNNNFMRWLQP